MIVGPPTLWFDVYSFIQGFWEGLGTLNPKPWGFLKGTWILMNPKAQAFLNPKP